MADPRIEVSENLLEAVFSLKSFFELSRSVMYSAGLSKSSKFFYVTKEFNSETIGIPIAPNYLDVYDFYDLNKDELVQSKRNNSTQYRAEILKNSFPLVVFIANPLYEKPLPQIDLEEEVLRNDLFELYDTSLLWKLRTKKKILPILSINQPANKDVDEFQLLLLQQKELFEEQQMKAISKQYLMMTEGQIDFPLTAYEYSYFLDFFNKNYNWSLFSYSTKAKSFRDASLYYQAAQQDFSLEEMLEFNSLEDKLNLKNFVF